MARKQKIQLKRQDMTGLTPAQVVGKIPAVAGMVDGELAVNTVDGKVYVKKTPPAGSPVVVEVGNDLPANPTINDIGKFLQYSPHPLGDGTDELVRWVTPDAVGAMSVDIPYNQKPQNIALAIGQLLYHAGTRYELALANDMLTSDVIGIVTSITPPAASDPNDPKAFFTLTTSGFVNLTAVLPDPKDAAPSMMSYVDPFTGITKYYTTNQNISTVTDLTTYLSEVKTLLNITTPMTLSDLTEWIPGRPYYLSAQTPGALTAIEPTAAMLVNKPVLFAVGPTSTHGAPNGVFCNFRGILNAIPESDIDNLLPPQAGNAGRALVAGADGNSYWGFGSGSTASSFEVTQAGHGFAVGTLVRHDGTQYIKSCANTAVGADVAGIVGSTTTDTFVLITQGIIDTLTGLTAGQSYFLTDVLVNAGQYVPAEPTTPSSISKPVLIAVAPTKAVFANWRGIAISVMDPIKELPPQAGNGGKVLSTDGTTPNWATSPVGYTGSQGVTGYVGSHGATGYTGSVGPQGPAGPTGAAGSQFAASGYMSMNNGFMMQWGNGVSSGDGHGYWVSFPTSFPNACTCVVMQEANSEGWVLGGLWRPTIHAATNRSPTGFTANSVRIFENSQTCQPGMSFSYIAIGY